MTFASKHSGAHSWPAAGGLSITSATNSPENDLNCEDFRSRAESWKYAAIALAFFNVNQIPFQEMENADSLLKGKGYCLAKEGEIYVIYLEMAATLVLTLKMVCILYNGYNPRSDGVMQQGKCNNLERC